MSKAINFYKASDGTPATDMSVALVGDWTDGVIGQPYSFEATQTAGATGNWSLEGTNAELANVLTLGNAVSPGCYWVTPSQPAGSAGVTSIIVMATHEKMRPRWTPTSGGTGTTCIGRVGQGASGVLVMLPDGVWVPFSSASALAQQATMITFGTAPPSSGTWATGAICFNSAPSTGQPKSWVCTVGGTPGTWVSEGNL